MSKINRLAKTQGSRSTIAVGEGQDTKTGQRKPRGRPTLTGADLANRRGELIYVFEAYWPEIGWQLQKAKTPDDIQNAFEPLRGKAEETSVALFLRTNSIASSGIEIRKTLIAFANAVDAERTAQNQYEAQRQACQLADAAVFEASSENRRTLKNEIIYRLKNVRQLEKDSTDKKSAMGEAATVLRKMEKALEDGQHSDLAAAQVMYQGAKGLCEGAVFVLKHEQEILRSVRDRLSAASTARLAFAKGEADKRQHKLQEALTNLAQATIRRERIQETLQDQQAGFMRAELLRFIRSKRTAHNPKSLANAIAGLPEIGCRVSFARCRRFLYLHRSGLNFRIFEFIGKCLRKRTSTHPDHLLQLLSSEVARLPNTERVNGKAIENFFKKYLEDNWFALKTAITNVLNSKQHPRQLPYILTDAFVKNLSKVLTSLDRLLLGARPRFSI